MKATLRFHAQAAGTHLSQIVTTNNVACEDNVQADTCNGKI